MLEGTSQKSLDSTNLNEDIKTTQNEYNIGSEAKKIKKKYKLEYQLLKNKKIFSIKKFTKFVNNKQISSINLLKHTIYKQENTIFNKDLIETPQLVPDSHTGKRQYICDFKGCTKSYMFNCRLIVHRRTHYQIKPFKCIYEGCHKSFNELGNLKTHMTIHTGLKAYKCSVDSCSKVFRTKGNLRDHIFIHDQSNERVCKFCCKTLSIRHMKHHLKNKHKVISVNRKLMFMNVICFFNSNFFMNIIFLISQKLKQKNKEKSQNDKDSDNLIVDLELIDFNEKNFQKEKTCQIDQNENKENNLFQNEINKMKNVNGKIDKNSYSITDANEIKKEEKKKDGIYQDESFSCSKISKKDILKKEKNYFCEEKNNFENINQEEDTPNYSRQSNINQSINSFISDPSLKIEEYDIEFYSKLREFRYDLNIFREKINFNGAFRKLNHLHTVIKNFEILQNVKFPLKRRDVCLALFYFLSENLSQFYSFNDKSINTEYIHILRNISINLQKEELLQCLIFHFYTDSENILNFEELICFVMSLL